MSVDARAVFALDDSFARELVGLHQPWHADPVAEPSLVILNEDLAGELGLDVEALRSPAGVALLAGNDAPAGVTTVAQAYAGHQFGGYSPRLGDGRALLLGEIVGDDGTRLDLHLKGSGRTPFARGGDGRAALGPMLREYVIGEAMHALGIPTTRALAVVSTGETILREVDGRVADVPGAVLARVASSHIRVGTFQFAAATGDGQLLRRLTDYAIARHAPEAAGADNPAIALFDHVVTVQASLVAQWMAVGFIHGVMNTDNTTISGETIDYGPCAFMDVYDPATVFSSIDHAGRYAYGNQPAIITWNLARLAEAMLPLFDDDTDTAIEHGDRRAASVPRALPGRLVDRDAHQTRASRRPRRGRCSRRRPAGADARTTRRLHVRDATRCRRRCAATPTRAGRCSPSRRRSTRGERGGRRCWATTGLRSPMRWTGSIRSTSRAITWSRRS